MPRNEDYEFFRTKNLLLRYNRLGDFKFQHYIFKIASIKQMLKSTLRNMWGRLFTVVWHDILFISDQFMKDRSN